MTDSSTSHRRIAIVTASYAGDFERCRLLCDTIDRHVTGHSRHLLLVSHRDVARFRALESSRRVVVDERDILPGWLHDLPDPFSLLRRRIWLSRHTAPLRGWHVQQLRRMAIAAHVDEDALLYSDSDVAFLKPFDTGRLYRDGKLRLFRRDNRLSEPGHDEHRVWSRQAGRVLGIADDVANPHDYISTLIAWKAETARAMCTHIENVSGRHWVSAIARSRKFAECMIYGRYVDDVLKGEGHFHDDTEFCRIYWSGPKLGESELREFVRGLAPGQVAVGMQSFIRMDIGDIRAIAMAA